MIDPYDKLTRELIEARDTYNRNMRRIALVDWLMKAGIVLILVAPLVVYAFVVWSDQ